MTDIRKFYADFVLPTVHEWQNDPWNVRRAMLAVCEVDTMMERIILHENPHYDRDAVNQARESLRQKDQALGIARDVHDTHKHGALIRKTAVITQGQSLHQEFSGGAFGSDAFGEVPFGSSDAELWVVLDNGVKYKAEDIIRRCIEHCEQELARLGR
jgi:hypothetical protein